MGLLLLLLVPSVLSALQASTVKNTVETYKELGLPLDELRTPPVEEPKPPAWPFRYDPNSAPISDWFNARYGNRMWFKIASRFKLIC